MRPMQRLRNASFLARLVLAWFTLAIGVAAAAPVLKPQSLELLCSGGAMKLLVKDAGGNSVSSHALDCPLCAVGDLPVPVASAQPLLPQPQQAQLPQAEVPRAARLAAAPPPARGPPAAQA